MKRGDPIPRRNSAPHSGAGRSNDGDRVSAAGSKRPSAASEAQKRPLPEGIARRAPLGEEQELIRRAQENDPRAVDQLVRRYQKKVYGLAYQFCGFDPEDARDTAQEALLQVFRNLKHFEDRSKFST